MRNKLLAKLSNMWRQAENHFQETESDSEKWKVKAFQDEQHLTEKEEKELSDILMSAGV